MKMKKMKRHFAFRLALVAASLLFGAAQVHAQLSPTPLSRTWVSGVGDDVNSCGRYDPCKTFQRAFNQTATGGEITALDAGGFGAVNIDRSVTITSQLAFGGILAAATTGVVVNAPAGHVVILRNLAINGNGNGLNGVNFIAGGRLVVENARIYGFSGHGILFQPSGASTLIVTASAINNNVGGGIHVKPGSAGMATAVLDGVTLIANGRGLRAEDGSSVEVRNSHATLSTNSGFVAAGTSRPVSMFVDRSAATYNTLGGVHAGTMATVRISNFTATGNGTGLSMSGGSIMSFVNNQVSGNTTDGAPTLTASEK
jgi:hypothetical protein